MRLALTLPLFLAAFAMPLAAQAADPRVEDQGAGLFAVFPAGGLSASEAFCTAGGFAQARLGLGPTDRIWRVTPVPRRSGQPMVFSTRAQDSAGRSGLVLLGPDDGSITVGFAQSLCFGLRNLN